MALIIENGSIVNGANSLVTVSEYREYLEIQGDDTQNETESEVEARLIKAMRYINRLESSIKGRRVQYDPPQPLVLPRYGLSFFEEYLFPSDKIPNEFKNAQIIAARTLLFEELEPDLDSGNLILAEKIRIEGAVEQEIKYDNTGKKQKIRSKLIRELKPYTIRKTMRLLI